MPGIDTLLSALFTPNTLTPNQNFKFNPETGEVVGLPYKTPGFWDKFLNSDAARVAQAENARVTQLPTLAPFESDVAAKARLQGLKTLSAPLQSYFPGKTPDEITSTLATYGSQGALNENIKDLNRRYMGAPTSIGQTGANADIAESALRQKVAAGALSRGPLEEYLKDINISGEVDRAPIKQGILGQALTNQARDTFDITPKALSLQEIQTSGALSRAPEQNRIADIAQKTAETEALIAQTEAETGRELTNKRAERVGSLKETLANNIAGQLYTSRHPALPESRLQRNINGPGWSVNPDVPSIFQRQAAETGIGSIPGSTSSIPLGNGTHIVSPSNVAPVKVVPPIGAIAPLARSRTGGVPSDLIPQGVDKAYLISDLNALMTQAGIVPSAIAYPGGTIGKFFGTKPNVNEIQSLIDKGTFKKYGVSDQLIAQIQDILNKLKK